MICGLWLIASLASLRLDHEAISVPKQKKFSVGHHLILVRDELDGDMRVEKPFAKSERACPSLDLREMVFKRARARVRGIFVEHFAARRIHRSSKCPVGRGFRF